MPTANLFSFKLNFDNSNLHSKSAKIAYQGCDMDIEPPAGPSDYTIVDEYISELSHQILVSEEKLREKLEEGHDVFFDYIDRKYRKYGTVLHQARKDFDQIFSRYSEIFAGNELSQRESNTRVARGLTKQLLMKIVRQSNLFLGKKKCIAYSINTKSLRNKRWKILAERNKEGDLQIIRWSGKTVLASDHPNFIGKGGFGSVQKVTNLSKARVDVLKSPYRKDRESRKQANDDINNEYKKLRELYRLHGVKLKGIQTKPSGLFHIHSRDGDDVAILEPYYNKKNLNHIIEKCNPSPRLRLKIALDLLYGLRTLHKSGMVHGDIKPGNCFAREDGNGSFIELADFGGARYFHELSWFDGMYMGTVVTPGYYTKTDQNRLLRAYERYDSRQWKRYLVKRDIYAVAKTIWALLTDTLPKDQRTDSRGRPRNVGVINDNYDDSIADILLQALAEDPVHRPEVHQMINVMQQLLDA